LELGDDHAAGDVARNRLALGFQAEARGALLGCRDSVVEEKTSAGQARHAAAAARPDEAF